MRDILIVGAGQSGLQLGLSLLAEGYEVTIMSARTPQEIRTGWPTSTQDRAPHPMRSWSADRSSVGVLGLRTRSLCQPARADTDNFEGMRRVWESAAATALGCAAGAGAEAISPRRKDVEALARRLGQLRRYRRERRHSTYCCR